MTIEQLEYLEEAEKLEELAKGWETACRSGAGRPGFQEAAQALRGVRNDLLLEMGISMFREWQYAK